MEGNQAPPARGLPSTLCRRSRPLPELWVSRVDSFMTRGSRGLGRVRGSCQAPPTTPVGPACHALCALAAVLFTHNFWGPFQVLCFWFANSPRSRSEASRCLPPRQLCKHWGGHVSRWKHARLRGSSLPSPAPPPHRTPHRHALGPGARSVHSPRATLSRQAALPASFCKHVPSALAFPSRPPSRLRVAWGDGEENRAGPSWPGTELTGQGREAGRKRRFPCRNIKTRVAKENPQILFPLLAHPSLSPELLALPVPVRASLYFS